MWGYSPFPGPDTPSLDVGWNRRRGYWHGAATLKEFKVIKTIMACIGGSGECVFRNTLERLQRFLVGCLAHSGMPSLAEVASAVVRPRLSARRSPRTVACVDAGKSQ